MTQTPTSTPTRWEYIGVSFNKIKNQLQSHREATLRLFERFDELGEEGWEMVCNNGNGLYVFKRPKASNAVETYEQLREEDP